MVWHEMPFLDATLLSRGKHAKDISKPSSQLLEQRAPAEKVEAMQKTGPAKLLVIWNEGGKRQGTTFETKDGIQLDTWVS